MNLKSEINERECGIAEKYPLGRFKIRHKQGLYIFLKEGIYLFSLSSQPVTNSLFEEGSHFAEKLIYPFLSSKKQVAIFLHTPL